MPNANIVLILERNLISFLKYEKQVINSFDVGLSPGGTHFKAAVRYVLYNWRPSSLWSDLGWLANLALKRHLNKKSADLSPVNTLPVLFPPCAAGASPKIISWAFI